MTHDEIVTLLQVVQAYDRRDIDPLMIAAWSEAARRKSWTFNTAVEAVHQHYADSTDWLMPGRITQLIAASGEGRKWQE